MNLKWEYKQLEFKSEKRTVSISHDTLLHQLGIDEDLEITTHIIRDLDQTETNLVKWQTPFYFIPEYFVSPSNKTIQYDTIYDLGNGIQVCYEGQGCYHLIIAIYKHAQGLKFQKRMVYFWLHEQTLIVLVFEDSVLKFGNFFEVDGINEVMYFILSAANECGFNQNSFAIVGDGENHELSLIQVELQKLKLGLIFVEKNELYPGYFASPYQHFSFYLKTLMECALPEEI